MPSGTFVAFQNSARKPRCAAPRREHETLLFRHRWFVARIGGAKRLVLTRQRALRQPASSRENFLGKSIAIYGQVATFFFVGNIPAAVVFTNLAVGS
jgi:hypothetical protein